MYPPRPSAPHAFPTFAREKHRRLSPALALGARGRRGGTERRVREDRSTRSSRSSRSSGRRADDDDDDDDDDDARGRGQLKIIDTRAVPSIDLRCRGI